MSIYCKKIINRLKKFVEDYKADIMSEAEKLRGGEMPELTEEMFALFGKTGNRLIYENIYFARRKYLLVYGLATYIAGVKRHDIAMFNAYGEILEKVMNNICDEECWALPAHVDMKNADWRKSLDLFACETAQSLAEIIILLPGIGQKTVENAVRNIFDRVIMPFFYAGGRGGAPGLGFETNTSNWSAVCAGCIGAAAIYLERYMPDEVFENIIIRVNNAMKYYIEGFSDDGICYEGLDYWNYGMSYFIMYEDMMHDRFSRGAKGDEKTGDYMLLQPKVLKIMRFQGMCYFSSGKTVSFSDGSSETKYRMGTASYIAGITGEIVPDIDRAGGFGSDPCYRFACGYRDIILTEEYIKKLETGKCDIIPEKRKYCFFEKGMWAIMESENGAGFAIKGGNNGEPHNHNDVGSFIYYLADMEIIADLGAGEYTKDYFGDGRYDIFCNSAKSHNIPIINGMYQQAGKERGAGRFVEIGDPAGNTAGKSGGSIGKSIRENTGGNIRGNNDEKSDGISDVRGIEIEFGGYAEADTASDAEPISASTAESVSASAGGICVIRRAFFNMKDGSLKIIDTFSASRSDIDKREESDIEAWENLLLKVRPYAKNNPNKNTFTADDDIIIGGATLRIEPGKAGESIESIKIELSEHIHKNHQGIGEKVWLLRFKVPGCGAEGGFSIFPGS